MKTLYFDCFAGASGDMILGALVGAGVDPHALIEQLQLLGVGGWQIDFERVDRSGIGSTYAKVQTAHEHAHRHLSDILKIIYGSRLNDRVKDRAARIFSRRHPGRSGFSASSGIRRRRISTMPSPWTR